MKVTKKTRWGIAVFVIVLALTVGLILTGCLDPGSPGGSDQDGYSSGGTNTGSNNPSGTNTGNTNPSGSNPGDNSSGGTNSGGSNTGGANTGGTGPGGSNTGGNNGGGESGGNEEPVYENDHLFTVANAAQWNEAISGINNSGNNKSYIITITNDFSIPGHDDYTFSPTGLTVTIQGNKTISLSNSGCLLVIDDTQKIVIEDLNLRGLNNNDYYLVGVYAGNFTMQGNASVQGNFSPGVNVYGGTFNMEGNASVFGNSLGGVLITSAYVRGNFTMNGGSITGNGGTKSGYAHTFGGVCVLDGTFTMNGGTISNNAAAYDGGGVVAGIIRYSDDAVSFGDGTFNMNGGIISDNTASGYGGGVFINESTFAMKNGTISRNTATQGGGGVAVRGGIWNNTATGESLKYFGSFNMSGGTISDNTTQYRGGGVFLSDGWGPTTFSKTGGIITGYGSDISNGNIAKRSGIVQSDQGHAIYAEIDVTDSTKRKETTSGPGDILYFNNDDGTFSGAWDY